LLLCNGNRSERAIDAEKLFVGELPAIERCQNPDAAAEVEDGLGLSDVCGYS
jgi:hypothetical protein